MKNLDQDKTIRFARILRNFISIISLGLSLAFIESSYCLIKAQIVPDNTLADGPSIFNSETNKIEGGTKRGTNLFHSFKDFNTLEGQKVYFVNPSETINIIARVTGDNLSNLRGKLGVDGKANLFLVNPHGISFGSTASLDMQSSFLATTANAVQFGGQGFFDTESKDSLPSLTVAPSGFLFRGINNGLISNYSSQDSGKRRSGDIAFRNTNSGDIAVRGLKVPDKHSLILLGGEITIDNGGLYALGGQVGIGSVAGMGIVSLSLDDNNLSISFPDDLTRDNVLLLNGARVDASGNGAGGGSIKVIGKDIQLKGASRIVSETTGQQDGRSVIIDAVDTLELTGFSRGGAVSTLTSSFGKAGNIGIAAKKITLTNGAQILSGTVDRGAGGDIAVNASDLLDIKVRSFNGIASGISSTTFASGPGGKIEVETNTNGNLLLSDGGFISAGGGGIRLANRSIIPGTGDGGDLDIKVGNFIQIDGSDTRLSSTHNTGTAGNVSIDTKFLFIQNGGEITVSSGAKAGNLEIVANSLSLDGGTVSADAGVSGANILLTTSNLLSLKNESKITATASKNADGGNIEINTPILLTFPPTGFDGSDIVANADKGRGGNIVINSKGIFGIQKRNSSSEIGTNDISASSQFGPSGQVQINSAINPTQGIEELPSTVIDPSSLVAQNPCKRSAGSEFVRSGRGGLPSSISQDIDSNTSRVGLVQPIVRSAEKVVTKPVSKVVNSQPPALLKIVPAQGWIYNDKGQAVLVAYNPSTSGPQRSQPAAASCPAF